MLANIIVWLMIVWIGVWIMYYSQTLTQLFGRVAWADKNVWWTRQFFVLMGFVVCILWMFFVFWLMNVSQVQDSAINANLSNGRLGETTPQ